MDTVLLDEVPRAIAVEEEPALDIALPQVFVQPDLVSLQREKLPHVDWLIARLARRATDGQALGPDYQTLVNEFQPLLSWAVSCWDYLLTTEGCRFVLRKGDEKLFCRGDFRAMTSDEFSRLAHRIFRECMLEYAQTTSEASFAGFLRAQFWERLREAYRRLEIPPDPRQRTLTAYSYLRCVPYRFLNDLHQALVGQALSRLSATTTQTLSHYFLCFFTVAAAAETMRVPVERVELLLHQGLVRLLIRDRLVYCLLRQIERY